jgi:diguanylate cyclase (GGDEF)-like protein
LAGSADYLSVGRTSTAHRAHGGVDSALALGEREAALARLDQLSADAEDSSVAQSTISELIADAEGRGWPEVALAGLYAESNRARFDGEAAHLAAVERLLDRAIADGDLAMTAIAYARRARLLSQPDNPSSSVAADGDLARASVLIEGAVDGGKTLARAHINCAIAYGLRDLWELEDEHYRAAEETLTKQGIEGRLRNVLLYNHAEMQLNWAYALRELGDSEALQFRARAAARALAAADVPDMPAAWREELAIFSGLLAAIAPGAISPPAISWAPPDGEYAGYVHLTRALTAADRDDAMSEALRAIERIDADTCPNAYSLALSAAAEIESANAGHETAGLRYARHLALVRWNKRLSALAAMQSRLQAERLSTEHALLTQHAYLDDLTRLGNRRAMARYVEHLLAADVTSVAMILLDVDRFKDINDTFGHAVGDAVLVRLAGLLRSAVRPEDVAVRLGGDEFLILLSTNECDATQRRAESIIASIDAEPWGEIAPGLVVRASAGVACGDPHQLERVSSAADSALYRSKAAGGSRFSES